MCPHCSLSAYEMGVGDLADVEVLDGLLGEGEEAGAEAVALVGLAVDEAVLVERTQQAQGRGLVHAEPVGDLAEVGGALARAAAGCSARGRRSGSWRAYLLEVLIGCGPAGAEAKCLPRRVVEGGQPVGVRPRAAARRDRRATVRAAAAMRWPCRSRSRTGSPRRVAERNPAAKASPAPTGATTSTRGAGAWVTVSGRPARCRRPEARRPARSGAGGRRRRVGTRSLRALLHHQHLRLRQRRPDRRPRRRRPHASSASSSPTKTRSAAAGQVEQHARARRRRATGPAR